MEIKEKGGLKWFQEIQNMDYKDAHAALVTLTGIGPKVKKGKTFTIWKKKKIEDFCNS